MREARYKTTVQNIFQGDYYTLSPTTGKSPAIIYLEREVLLTTGKRDYIAEYLSPDFVITLGEAGIEIRFETLIVKGEK